MSQFQDGRRLGRQFVAAAFLVVGFGIVVAIALNTEVPRREINAALPEGCRVGDAAAVARLKPLLERTDAKASAVTAQALQSILAARGYCDRGYADRALTLYRQVDLVLAGFQDGGNAGYRP